MVILLVSDAYMDVCKQNHHLLSKMLQWWVGVASLIATMVILLVSNACMDVCRQYHHLLSKNVTTTVIQVIK